MKNFADRLLDLIDKMENPSVIGLDPVIEKIPNFIKEENVKKYGNTLEAAGASIWEFNKEIIDYTYDIVGIYKPQIAFYEQYGLPGIRAFIDTVNYIKKKERIVIEDAKRNDIMKTAEAYAKGHIGEVTLFNGEKTPVFDVDAITVNAYLGTDSISPFVEICKKYSKGIFILAKTSNPSAVDFQDIMTDIKDWQKSLLHQKGIEVSEKVQNFVVIATFIYKWSEETEGSRGYRSVGAVVGATYPQHARILRKILDKNIFLVPGYGAQGGTAEDVLQCFNEDGYGAIISSSSGIIYAYQNKKWKDKFSEDEFGNAARAAALEMKNDIITALKRRYVSW